MSSLFNMSFQEECGHIYSRKLLFQSYLVQQSAAVTITPTASPSSPSSVHNKFDANVVMVLSVLVCALICSLALNSIIRCVLRCTRFVGSNISASQESNSARLAISGIKKKALKSFLTVNYWEGLQLPGLGKECVICLGDFLKGDHVKVLPKCNHGFHVRCIDKWLSSHSSCPTCRQCLNEICQKIVAGGNCSSTASSQPEEQDPSNASIVNMSPLQNEGVLRNY